jgi:hypothetical protein
MREEMRLGKRGGNEACGGQTWEMIAEKGSNWEVLFIEW